MGQIESEIYDNNRIVRGSMIDEKIIDSVEARLMKKLILSV